mmetsp:Transcript_17814/g.29993  ORF Transcript_17814/g.29993 Transcript_17814/m.29993 type:complete len:346 (-) Transcript_17814:652-1689(-)
MRAAFFILISLALFICVEGLEFPGAKEQAGAWKMDNDDQTLITNSDSAILNLRFALHPNNAARLEDKVNLIADPKSTEFRKYLSQREITELVSVSEKDLSSVLELINRCDITVSEIPVNRDWISVRASPAAIEKALDTKLAVWVNKKTGQRKVGAKESYSIPDEFSHIIQFIPGLTSFSYGSWRPIVQSASSKTVQEPNGLPQEVTPATIYETYQSDTSGSHGSKLGSQAVIEYGKLANFNEADLEQFFDELAPNLEGETCGTAYGVNNGKIRGSVEANLDVQYMMAVGQFVTTSTYKIDEGLATNIEDQMLDYAYIVGNQTDPALVHSISYGEYGGSYDNNTVQ